MESRFLLSVSVHTMPDIPTASSPNQNYMLQSSALVSCIRSFPPSGTPRTTARRMTTLPDLAVHLSDPEWCCIRSTPPVYCLPVLAGRKIVRSGCRSPHPHLNKYRLRQYHIVFPVPDTPHSVRSKSKSDCAAGDIRPSVYT